MGIFDALNTAVSGLQAQSFSLQNISGDIANSQTTAFKGTDTQFEDLLSAQANAGEETAGSVIASSSSSIDVQGDIESTQVGTNMAINGDGFFVVQKPTGFSDGIPSFSGVNMYTRQGDFQVQNGYLVNGAGYYLMGVPIDPTTDNPEGSVPSLLQFQNNFLPAQATSSITYSANLPTTPSTADANSSVPGSELLNPADFMSNPLAASGQPAIMTGSGATLLPDALATVTGTADTSGYVVPSGGGNITINGTSITLAAGDTAADIATAISGAGRRRQRDGECEQRDRAHRRRRGDRGRRPEREHVEHPVLPRTERRRCNSHQSAHARRCLARPNADRRLRQQFDHADFRHRNQPDCHDGPIEHSAPHAQRRLRHPQYPKWRHYPDRLEHQRSDHRWRYGDAGHFRLADDVGNPARGTVIGSDVNSFLNSSVGGGAITAYDQAGSPVNLQFRWAKVDSASLGSGHSDTWALFYQTNCSPTSSQSAWQNVGTDFTFGANGMPSPAISGVTLSDVSVDGVSLGNVQLSFGSGGLTQFAATNGTVNVNLLQQNGLPQARCRPFRSATRDGYRFLLERPDRRPRPSHACLLQRRGFPAERFRQRLRTD